MCLSPVNIITPKKHISRQGGTPFLLSVPCGHCAECDKVKRNEYFMRSYYEALYTHRRGGYMLFDTLTYSDHTLPHISDSFELFKNSIFDYPCFNRRHIRLFMVLLREHLSNLGYDVKDNLKYFLTSEYGTSESATHRPHYHVLFYVTIPNLDPVVLSKEIANCWSYGRTDGCPWQSAEYVRKKRVFDGSDSYATEKACMYVAKYVVKQTSFTDVIKSRTDALCLRHFEVTGEKVSDYVRKSFYKEVRKLCDPFHVQSHHFGEAALLYNNKQEIFDSGMMKYKTSDDIVVTIPLPTYFARKLFYELTEDFRGEKVWQLTEYGKEYKMNRINTNIRLLANRIYDTFLNYSTSPNVLSNFMDDIKERLGNRSYFAFAEYLALYKGRIHSENKLKDLDLCDFVYRQFYWDYSLSGSWFANYTSKADRQYFGGIPTITNRNIGDSKHGWNTPPYTETYFNHGNINPWFSPVISKTPPYDKWSVDRFIKKFVIDDTFHPAFAGFDELYTIFCNCLYPFNKSKQKAYELKTALQENRKNFKNLKII